ncbi:MAG TPA: hypothetical protein VEG60_25170 [Candidatus Binatia bacterium]|nr:hypothetical protein [Candidatus Binatia bacterium]
MIRPDFKKLLMDQRGAAVILWSFFIISIVLYIVIAQNVLANPKYAKGLSFAETARIVLWFLVLIDLGYYIFWKRRYLTPAAILDKSQKTKLFRALQEYKGAVEQRAASVVSTYITRKVVLFAIIEAIAVYGLVLGIVGRYLGDQYLLSALSLVLLALEYPTERFLEGLLRQVEGSPLQTKR